jgi:hypothetical protein
MQVPTGALSEIFWAATDTFSGLSLEPESGSQVKSSQ